MNWKKNIYEENKWAGIGYNPLISEPDASDLAFIETANGLLSNAVEVLRHLIPSHQSAFAIIINKDWKTVRKFFSLSEKYEAWKHYAEPATGYGIHAYLLDFNKPIRLTQAELENHPQWKNFGTEQKTHPPMRGWLAVPLKDGKGNNWGLAQLSDKLHGDYTSEDEQMMVDFMQIIAMTLELAWEKRNANKKVDDNTK